MKEQLQTIGEQLIPIVAYGDAAGLPFETHKRIVSETGFVDRLYPVSTNPYFKGDHPAGTWSDDTQLSVAVAESLIEKDGFNLKTQAKKHVNALDETTFGWGGSTTRSIERVRNGVSPHESGESGDNGKGAGNGVLMKMAPLVYWQKARQVDHEKAQKEVIDLTRMTHATPEAVVSSLVHRAVLGTLLDLSPDTDRSQLNRLYQHAVTLAQRYEDGVGPTSEVLRRLEPFTIPGITIPLKAGHIIEASPKGGFYAPETLLMAYGSFLIEPRFPDSVYRAVELGGDTDSIASIVGTMSLFLYGQVEKPHDYDKIQDIGRLQRVSSHLTRTALRL